MSELTVVGKPVHPRRRQEKVTGQIVYGYDLVLPNMLYGKTLFSTKAHAKIKRINTEKAKQLARRRCRRDRRRRAVDTRRIDQRQAISRARQSALYRRTCRGGRGGRRRYRAGRGQTDRSRIRRSAGLHRPGGSLQAGRDRDSRGLRQIPQSRFHRPRRACQHRRTFQAAHRRRRRKASKNPTSCSKKNISCR